MAVGAHLLIKEEIEVVCVSDAHMVLLIIGKILPVVCHRQIKAVGGQSVRYPCGLCGYALRGVGIGIEVHPDFEPGGLCISDIRLKIGVNGYLPHIYPKADKHKLAPCRLYPFKVDIPLPFGHIYADAAHGGIIPDNILKGDKACGRDIGLQLIHHIDGHAEMGGVPGSV